MKKMFMMGFTAGLFGGLSIGLFAFGVWAKKRG